MGRRTEGAKPVMCGGDPYGVPACMLRASRAVLGTLVGDAGEPLIVLMPACDLHHPLVLDYLSATPVGEQTTSWPIDAWDELVSTGNQEFGGVWAAERRAG